MSSNSHRSIKVVLVGDMYVGKTSLSSVFVTDHFRESYTANVGGHYMAKTIETPKVTLQIWDTMGMERFRAMLPHYMRGAECAVIVYDISVRETFVSVKDFWINFIGQHGPDDMVKVLVGNKSDIQMRAVKHAEGYQFAERHNMLFFETSAKFNINVQKVFIESATAVVKTVHRQVQENGGVQLKTSASSTSKCCLV